MLIQFYYWSTDNMALEVTKKLKGITVKRGEPSGFRGCDAPSGYNLIDTLEKTIDNYREVLYNDYKGKLESGDFITEE